MNNCRFRLAKQGKQSDIPVLVLGLIVYILIGLLHDILSNVVLIKGVLPMKTKVKEFFIVCSKSILLSIWTMSANLLAGALLA